MILYHGSLETVATPRIMKRAFYRPLDFGTGFYATSSRDLAVRWVRNRLDYDAAAPRGCVNVYEFDEPGFATSGLSDWISTSGAGVELARGVRAAARAAGAITAANTTAAASVKRTLRVRAFIVRPARRAARNAPAFYRNRPPKRKPGLSPTALAQVVKTDCLPEHRFDAEP